MCLMAQAVKNAGVKAIRAQGVLDIKQIKEQTNLPVIGIIKKLKLMILINILSNRNWFLR